MPDYVRAVYVCVALMTATSGALAASGAGDECGSEAVRVIAGKPLELESCASVTSREIDVLSAADHFDTCWIPDTGREKFSAMQYYPNNDRANTYLRFSANGRSIYDLTVQPRSGLKVVSGANSITIACDSVNRVYVANSLVGYVVAYRLATPPGRDGPGPHELWRATLPAFVSVESGDSLSTTGKETPVDPAQLIAALSDYGCLVQQIMPRDGFVLVEHSVAKKGFIHSIFSRTGRLVTVVGPWEGVVIGTSPKGWVFATDGGKELSLFAPRFRVEIGILRGRDDAVVAHALAWLMPRPTNRDGALTDCLARPVSELRYWLDKDFDESAGNEARRRLATLGGQWLASLEDRPAIRSVLRQFDPSSRSWQAALHQAFLDAAVDVDIASTTSQSAVAKPGRPD